MCGVFGIYAPDRDVARLTHFALHALQHRGQEAAGIAVSENGRLTVLQELGLITNFSEQKLRGLRGEAAIGHTRYSTTGSSTWANAQPLLPRGNRTVALAHNGNLVNANELRSELETEGAKLGSTSDSELIAVAVAGDPRPLEEAVPAAMARLEGAYSVVAIADGKLLAFRDPHGFRPLVLGRMGEDWIVASETCTFDLLGAEFVREVALGELVMVDATGLRSIQAVPAAGDGALCIFEYFYFSRPDSHLAGVEAHAARVRMGERLAEESPVDADFVLPIPDSGTPAAVGFARASGIPFSEGLIKNRYVGRTFIQPDQELRQRGIRLKFNPLDEVAGKRVVVVDDSIVRGTTTAPIVAMLRRAGAREIHVRIHSPQMQHPCYMGVDTGRRSELIAATHTLDEIRGLIDADSLGYLSEEGLLAAVGREKDGERRHCTACFDGRYPIDVPMDVDKFVLERG
jgi:amidophosphoribosyltransferase